MPQRNLARRLQTTWNFRHEKKLRKACLGLCAGFFRGSGIGWRRTGTGVLERRPLDQFVARSERQPMLRRHMEPVRAIQQPNVVSGSVLHRRRLSIRLWRSPMGRRLPDLSWCAFSKFVQHGIWAAQRTADPLCLSLPSASMGLHPLVRQRKCVREELSRWA